MRTPPRSSRIRERKTGVQSVARAVAILRAVAASPDGLTPREISDRVGLALPTTYHLIGTLANEGLLARTEGRPYRLGLGVSVLAEAFQRQLAAPDQLVAPVHEVATRTAETAYVVGWASGEIVIHARVSGRHVLSVSDSPLGLVTDAHARSSGKALLAFAHPAVRSGYLARHPLTSRTPNTIVDAVELEREFDRIRERGYATDFEEYAVGVCCLSAPVDGGSSPFAISLSAPRDRFTDNADAYVRVILEVTAAATGAHPSAIGGPT